MMTSRLTREEAYALLKKYNKEPFHIQHALTVEGVMRWYARELGYGEDEEFWGLLDDSNESYGMPSRVVLLV